MFIQYIVYIKQYKFLITGFIKLKINVYIDFFIHIYSMNVLKKIVWQRYIFNYLN